MRLIWGAVGIAIILSIAYFVNEDRLAKQKIEQARWAPIEQCADEIVFSRFEDFKYKPTDWNEVLEQIGASDAEGDLAKRMKKRCDGLVMLDGDAKKILETARAMIETIPVAAREPCGCAVEGPSAWRLRKLCADMQWLETALKIYRLDNFTYPSSAQGLAALVSPSTLSPEPRNFKDGGYVSELPTDPWGNPYGYRNDEVFSWGADGISHTREKVPFATALFGSRGVMRAMEAEGCF